jgi:uncharacterized protein YecT (DUF1311 family)
LANIEGTSACSLEMMVMTKWTIVMAAMVLAVPAARAGDQRDAGAGCDGVSTPEIVNCVMAKTAQWDKRMNAAYQKAMKEDDPKRQEQLRTAQRLWIQFRDANCLYFDMGEGTIARIDAADCMRNMTEARARELEDFGQH